MSPEYEFEGKTVEKALQTASEKLNIPAKELKHDVLSYGSTGIFGLVGTKKARIRVRIQRPVKNDVSPKNDNEIAKTGDSSLKEDVRALVDSTFEERNGHEKKEKAKPEKIEDGWHPAVENGRQALKKIVASISEDAKIDIERKGGDIIFSVEGGNSGTLIGKHGQTLEAIQYLIEKIVNKESEKRIRIKIDIQGYIAKRKNYLRKTASRLAEKAKTAGKPMTMGQMNAHDRRIVHIALRKDHSVRTQSIGNGALRKLVIFPKKSAEKPKPDEKTAQEAKKEDHE